MGREGEREREKHGSVRDTSTGSFSQALSIGVLAHNPHNSCVEALTPKGGGWRAFERCFRPGGGMLTNGISALPKEALERPLTPPPSCDSTRTRLGPRVLTQQSYHIDLRLPASGNARNKFRSFISHSVRGALL